MTQITTPKINWSSAGVIISALGLLWKINAAEDNIVRTITENRVNIEAVKQQIQEHGSNDNATHSAIWKRLGEIDNRQYQKQGKKWSNN